MNRPDSPGGPTITLLKHIMRPDACEPVTLASALHQIRSGRWKAEVEAIRSFDKAGDKQCAAEAKGQLPCFLFAGRFERANDNGLVSHSGLAVLDIDNLDQAKLAEIRRQAVGQAWVAATFTSPRGRGLKLVCRIGEQDSEGHKRTADALRGHCATLFNVEVDRGAEVSRKCFVSFDPDLYHNPSATAWTDLTDCFPITESRRAGELERGMLPLTPLSLSSELEAPAAIDPETVYALLKKWDLLPCKPHDTHHRLFELARLANSDRQFGRTLSKSEKEGLFHAWHQATMDLNPNFLSHSKGMYLGEFRTMLPHARVPKGYTLQETLDRARAEPLPPEATHPDFQDSPEVQLMIAFCYQLSHLSADSGVFYLGCRDAGRLLGISHTDASVLLRGLVAGGILLLVRKAVVGPNGEAARYKWAGSQ